MTDPKPFENAFWIWDGGEPAPVNAYRIFRKTFAVPPDGASQAVARIYAETFYQLVLNGQTVAHGPAPSARGICAYDEVPLTLDAGRDNVLVAYVHFVGVPMFTYHRNRAGFLFEMGDVVSDDTWLVAKESGWLPSPRLSVMRGFAEFRDCRLGPSPDEFSEEIDPSQWTQASNIAPSYAAPWPVMEKRDIPMIPLEDQWQPYSALIGFGNTGSDADAVDARGLENEQLLPLTSGSVHREDSGRILVAPGDKGIWLLFDMGEEVSGTVDIDVESDDEEANAGCVIDIGYDEALRPGETPSGLKHYWSEDNQNVDRFTLGGGDSFFWTLQPRAFRYVRLAIRGLEAPLIIDSFGVHRQAYPVADRAASFACSDPRLDQMWEIGKRTLHLCMDTHFMDCPWRERGQYIADARIEAIGARYCFGDSLLHRRFLRQMALSQHADGSIDPCGPGEWDTVCPKAPIPGFIAIYIQSVLDYYQMTADGALVEEIMPAVQKAMGWLATHGGAEGGLLNDIPGWDFTDWAQGLDNWSPNFEKKNEGIAGGVNLFYLEALRAAARLAEQIGDSTAARSYGTRAEMVAAAFDSLFWNPLRGLYVDAVVKGEPSIRASQQVNILALLSEIGGEARRASVLGKLFADESLTQIGSPYFSYYLVQALSKYGRRQQALDYIRENWGAMMDSGATTWWETWDGAASRCHAWSIAPSIWLPEQLLGVTPREPGFACVSVAPKPCDLTWAKGIVPIPEGDVSVSWLKKDTRFTLDVSAPIGVHIHPTLPCRPGDELLVDCEPVHEDSIVRRSAEEAELAVLPGSGYRFEVIGK